MRSKALRLAGEPCEYCDGRLADVVIADVFRVGGRVIVLDGVPIAVCAKCGRKYYPAGVLKRLERVAKQAARGRSGRPAHLIRYGPGRRAAT